MLRINVLFFGMVRDITGCQSMAAEMPDGATVADAFDHFAGLYPKLGGLSASLVLAVNQHFVPRSQVLAEGDELAFLPPVSGGSGVEFSHWFEDEAGNFFATTRDPLSAELLSSRLVAPTDGALVTFDGVVRNNSGGRTTLFIDYEAYEPMAVRVMAAIGGEMAAKHEIGRIGILHRVGRLQIGESSILLSVASPHRKAAFEAAIEAMDKVKKLVPVWKKEHFADGEIWVEGAWDASVSGL